MSQAPLTLVEKIVAKCAVKGKIGPRQFIQISPDKCMTHDNTAAVMKKFNAMQLTDVHKPEQLVFTLDHNVQDKSKENLNKYASIANFAKQYGIDHYPAGRGIGHQVMVEEAHVLPGQLIVASDSHSNMYGGLGCLGTPVVRSDAAGIWATGTTWWQIPKLARVNLTGALNRQAGATSKDIIIALCGLFNGDEILNHAIEFYGDGIADLSIDDRLTIANMTTEWGAVAGIFPADDTTFSWLNRRLSLLENRKSSSRLNHNVFDHLQEKYHRGELKADDGAKYDTTLDMDISEVQPFVAGPNDVKQMRSVLDIEKDKVQIQKAYIVSCVNSRVDDLASAADVFRSVDVSRRKVAKGVEMYIAAASSEVEETSRLQGDWQVLVDAGAIPLPSGCGPCVGLGRGLLESGEVGISATNRNFKGRMGSRDASAYLGSPSVVAASALAGFICSPASLQQLSLQGGKINYTTSNNGFSGLKKHKSQSIVNLAKSQQQKELIPGFPEKFSGELLFCHKDNLDTDGIFAGTHTYKENLHEDEIRKVVMENYDPEFSKIFKTGDILIGGYNFGCGSSREQAATAFLSCGMNVILAGSFSETYKRNAFNNGLLCIEVPELVDFLKRNFGATAESVRTHTQASLDFSKSCVTISLPNSANRDKSKDGCSSSRDFPFLPLGIVAQELFVAGGIEKWITS